MLLQTNSYIVPRDKRMEHARLLRKFRQTLIRLGCDHFEVFEQVGANWNSQDNTGRFVQLMRFRDRRHQLEVQAAERTDPAAQALIKEFCDLINFPYQQQEGLFAVGYYVGFMRMPPAGQLAGPSAEDTSGITATTQEVATAHQPTRAPQTLPTQAEIPPTKQSTPAPAPVPEEIPIPQAAEESEPMEPELVVAEIPQVEFPPSEPVEEPSEEPSVAIAEEPSAAIVEEEYPEPSEPEVEPESVPAEISAIEVPAFAEPAAESHETEQPIDESAILDSLTSPVEESAEPEPIAAAEEDRLEPVSGGNGDHLDPEEDDSAQSRILDEESIADEEPSSPKGSNGDHVISEDEALAALEAGDDSQSQPLPLDVAGSAHESSGNNGDDDLFDPVEESTSNDPDSLPSDDHVSPSRH